MMSEATPRRPRSPVRHPRAALAMLIFVDFWERFSYYGLLAILVLFLKAPIEAGGLGWSESTAIRAVGIYGGLGFLLPLLGGYCADRFFGNRKALALGAGLMAAGHILLGFGVEAQAQIGIFISLGLVVLGNGLFKTPLITIIGELFSDDDGAQQRGFSLYYAAINAGALCAISVVGYLADRIGWDIAFGAAGAGMLLALAAYLLFAGRLLEDIGQRRQRSAAGLRTFADLTAGQRRNLRTLLIYAGTAIVFALGWFQLEGYWYVQIDNRVDRSVNGFVIPSTWFFALQTVILIVGTPVAGVLIGRCNGGRGVAPHRLFAVAFLLCAAAQSAGLAGELTTPAGEQIPIGWPVLLIALIATAELVLWPSTYALVYRLAPKALESTLMGCWLITIAVGKFGAGLIGGAAASEGALWAYPALILVLLAGSAFSILFLRGLLVRAADQTA